MLGLIAFNVTMFVAYQLLSGTLQNDLKREYQGDNKEGGGSSTIQEVGPEAPKSELLRKLPSDISKSEKEKHEAFLRENARDTAIVFINQNCNSSPTVAKIVDVTIMKIINEDKIEHTLMIANKQPIVVKPNTPYLIKVDTLEKGKLLPYACDSKDNLSGYIYVP